jgi:activator of 2-hydroxyglutaryl-CoA dehydratase
MSFFRTNRIKSYFCYTRYDKNNLTIKGGKLYYITNKNERSFIYLQGATMINLRLGIDIGSTTAKVVILDQYQNLLFSTYCRHNAETVKTLQNILAEARDTLGDVEVETLITGSAGLGVSERFHLSFIQEVIASAEVVKQR